MRPRVSWGVLGYPWMSWGVLGYPGVSWGNQTDPLLLVQATKQKLLCVSNKQCRNK